MATVTWSAQAYAARSMAAASFPYTESFDTNNYSDLYYLTGGATHTYKTGADCWSGGCAQFTPPTTQGAYGGLGNWTAFSGHGFTRYSIRWLEYWGTTYRENTINCKVMITETTGSPRPSVFDMEWTESTPYFFSLAGTDGTVQHYEDCDPTWWVCAATAFKVGDRANSHREGEWISFEYLVDLRSASPSGQLFITTTDGVFNETVVSTPTIAGSASVFEYIDFLGTFCDAGGGTASVADANNFYRIDEVIINGTTDGSSPYIGPPAGFVGGEPPAGGTTTFGSGAGSASFVSGAGSATFQ